MKIKVKFFATFKDLMGTSSLDLEVPEKILVAEFKKSLINSFPRIGPGLTHAIVARNRKFAQDDEMIQELDEIAVFPPVSGGNLDETFVDITDEEIDINSLINKVTFSTTGAVCTFTGVVRGLEQEGPAEEIIALEYEAYLPMGLEKINQVANEIRGRWEKVEGIAIVQRIGYLPRGTQTILIACSAPHRDDGIFEAARYGIDRLKEIVPVWKKEITNLSVKWKEGTYFPGPDD